MAQSLAQGAPESIASTATEYVGSIQGGIGFYFSKKGFDSKPTSNQLVGMQVVSTLEAPQQPGVAPSYNKRFFIYAQSDLTGVCKLFGFTHHRPRLARVASGIIPTAALIDADGHISHIIQNAEFLHVIECVGVIQPPKFVDLPIQKTDR